MIDKKNITGIILAGGKSSRMGTDKGFLMLNDKPFVLYSIDALKPLVSEIMIISDNADYDVFGLKRINDITKDAGPVAGICSGLEASSNTYNLILSCDIPLITSEILQKLIDNIDDTSQIIQVESKGKSMPLIAIYKKEVANTFDRFLKNDERRLRVAIKSCISKNIILEKEQEFSTMNVNTQNELKAVKMHINIKYFGQIAEVTQTEEESLEFSGGTVSELLTTLYKNYEELKKKDFQVAQNQELVSEETELTGAEIALLPPFAGG